MLTNGSDYFLFDLEYGFIHFDRYLQRKPPYHKVSDFLGQYSLKQHKLLLVIPSISREDRFKINRNKIDYEKVVRELAKYDNCEQCFKSNKDATIDKHYSDLQLPQDKVKRDFPDLPEWVTDATKQRKFPTYLLLAHCKRPYILPRIVESIRHDSAWKASRSI